MDRAEHNKLISEFQSLVDHADRLGLRDAALYMREVLREETESRVPEALAQYLEDL